MHEMSLAESVREIVEEAARAHAAVRVARVRLEIGRLAQVEVDAMRFAFDVVMRGSPADGAALDIVETPGTARCPRCARDVEIGQRGDACPACGCKRLVVTGGDCMRVIDLEIV